MYLFHFRNKGLDNLEQYRCASLRSRLTDLKYKGEPTEVINQVVPLHNSGLVMPTASILLPCYMHSFTYPAFVNTYRRYALYFLLITVGV